MFAQSLIYSIIFIVFVYAIWKFIITPILESQGVDVEGEQKIITEYTRKLGRLKEKHERLSTSADAAEESAQLTEQIKDLEDKIKEANERIKEMK